MKSGLKPPEEWNIPSPSSMLLTAPFLSQSKLCYCIGQRRGGRPCHGRVMAVVSARSLAASRSPHRWLVPVCVVLALSVALPLATIYSCVKSVLFFTWRGDGARLLIQTTSPSHCFLGMGSVALSEDFSFLLTSLLGTQTQNLGLVRSVF